MADRFPDYDVLAKRDTPSWNNQTRAAIDKRLALLEERSVLTDRQLQTLRAVAGRLVPQPEGRPPINTVAIVLDKIAHDRRSEERRVGKECVSTVRSTWSAYP